MVEAATELIGEPGELRQVVASGRQEEKRKAAVIAAPDESSKRRGGLGENGGKLGFAERAGSGKAGVDLLGVEHG